MIFYYSLEISSGLRVVERTLINYIFYTDVMHFNAEVLFFLNKFHSYSHTFTLIQQILFPFLLLVTSLFTIMLYNCYVIWTLHKQRLFCRH